jgi:hypothetical protein
MAHFYFTIATLVLFSVISLFTLDPYFICMMCVLTTFISLLFLIKKYQ